MVLPKLIGPGLISKTACFDAFVLNKHLIVLQSAFYKKALKHKHKHLTQKEYLQKLNLSTSTFVLTPCLVWLYTRLIHYLPKKGYSHVILLLELLTLLEFVDRSLTWENSQSSELNVTLVSLRQSSTAARH